MMVFQSRNDGSNKIKAKKLYGLSFLNIKSYSTILNLKRDKKRNFTLAQLSNFYWLGTSR